MPDDVIAQVHRIVRWKKAHPGMIFADQANLADEVDDEEESSSEDDSDFDSTDSSETDDNFDDDNDNDKNDSNYYNNVSHGFNDAAPHDDTAGVPHANADDSNGNGYDNAEIPGVQNAEIPDGNGNGYDNAEIPGVPNANAGIPGVQSDVESQKWTMRIWKSQN